MTELPDLLITITSVLPAYKDEMASWLEAEAEAALKLPGVSSTRVMWEADPPDYKLANHGVTTWLVQHDVDGPELENVFAEVRRRESVDSTAKRMIGITARREHRLYRRLPVPAIANEADTTALGDVINVVGWTPQPGAEDNLKAWYDDEHIPLLMAVPAWLRMRRYELVSGTGARYVAVHDLASVDTLITPHPSQAKSATTPWRAEVVAQREQYEALRYIRHDPSASG